jgi:hypothetical protein
MQNQIPDFLQRQLDERKISLREIIQHIANEFTQAEVCRMGEMNPKNISEYLSGKREMTTGKWEKIINAYLNRNDP